MDWNKAIKECPSNNCGKCQALSNDKSCKDNITKGICPIKKLENKEIKR